MKVELEFNLNDFIIDENSKEFWTVKGNEGYEFFLDKADVLMLSIGAGQYFDFEAYINGKFGRDILADFKTSTFLIENTRGLIDKQGEAFISFKIKPIIGGIENF